MSLNNIFNVIINLLSADLRMATPILLASLGLVLMYRSGLVNIGFEGIMLIGSLTAVIGTYYLNNVWLGLLVAMISCGMLGLLFAYLVVTLRANQVVVGAAFNILGAGLTATLFRAIFGINAEPIKIEGFNILPIPILSQIPVLGSTLFMQMGWLCNYIFLLLP
jgi:ABC-type uncharacterized transport system permease subunit